MADAWNTVRVRVRVSVRATVRVPLMSRVLSGVQSQNSDGAAWWQSSQRI